MSFADFRLSVRSVWERNPQVHHEDVATDTSDYEILWIFLAPSCQGAVRAGAPKGRVAESVTRAAL